MSKYNAIWEYVSKSNQESLVLNFDEFESICRVKIDHSFLNFKKELIDYGYEVGKISLKNQTVEFNKLR